MLGADQDNGMIISNEVQPEHLPWYAELADLVCDGLNECGYVYCPGGIMAQTESGVSHWKSGSRQCGAGHLRPHRTRLCGSVFSLIYAVFMAFAAERELQKTMLEQASKNSIFLAALAANALDYQTAAGYIPALCGRPGR